MMNVCFQCGIYRADKIVDPAGPHAICPECGYRHLFKQLPLLIVSGASGAGKSTVCHDLLGHISTAVLLDSDILWRAEFNRPDHRQDYFETWLRLCKNISQSGRPVVLFGAGAGVPDNIENCVERRYFSAVHYLALVCSEEELTGRLRQRPEWRGSGEPAYIDDHVRFNRWFQTYDRQPPIRLIDTTGVSLAETIPGVTSWFDECLRSSDSRSEFHAE